MNAFMLLLLRYLVIILVTVGLTGCYLPVRFDAEVEISRHGYYEMFFDGYIARIELFDSLNKLIISRDEENKQMEVIKRDFKRDTSTNSFKYIKKGHFHVNWQKSGDLTKVKTVVFFRRNENMLSISYNSTSGRVQVAGRSLGPKQRQQLHDIGLGMIGQLRVITDTNVISNNATRVKPLPKRGERFKMYTWEIKNIFNKTPRITLVMG
jgi:hypothetical protein